MRSLFCVLVLVVSTSFAASPDDLQSISVTVKAGNSHGSGTLVTREIDGEAISFVWTAAHVVDGLRNVREIIVNGSTRKLVEYKDAEVVQELQQDGRRIGEVKYDAKVIKVSGADYGEDLAILMIRRKGAYSKAVTAKFQDNPKYIPAIGLKLVHVGSLLGQFGANSYTNGIVSQTGKTLPMAGANVQVFDQVTVTAFPGSSGGGVFAEDSGLYVGMLTQGTRESQGFNFIVPIRRIRAWTIKAKIEWVLNPKAKSPKLDELDSIPIED